MIASGYQILVKQYAKQRPLLENIWNEVLPNGPQSKSLIEISGCPGLGKSLFLNQLMALAALPTSYGGKNAEIIFLDLSHKFDSRSFKALLKNILHSKGQSETTYDNVVTQCLQSIVHIPCYSLDQFEIAMHELDDLVWEHKKVSLLAIDDLDTFYWEDCYYQLQRMATHYQKNIKRLKQLCQEYHICCAYTVDTNYVATRAKGATSFTYFPNSMIDYKVKFEANNDGVVLLNNKPIKISESGIEFL